MRRITAMLLSASMTFAPFSVSLAGPSEGDRAAARQLGNAGVSAYQEGRYAEASRFLEQAYGALRAPSLGLWSARALVKVGKLVEAGERYLEVTRLDLSGGDLKVQKQSQVEAAAALEELNRRIPSIVVQLQG